MIEQFVTYDLAVKLKEMGFNEPCATVFKNGELIQSSWEYCTRKEKAEYIHGDKTSIVLAPLWQQAYWFLLKKFKEVNGFQAGTWNFTTDEAEYRLMISSCKPYGN